MRRSVTWAAAGLAALVSALGAPEGLAGQEDPPPVQEPPPAVRDTAAPPGPLAPEDRPRREGCELRLEPKPSTNLERVRRGDSYVHHIGGGMRWRCGNAEMEADSAVRYEAARRVEMMGNVDYRDTIRTLRSDFLTYYELPDLVVATGDVRLTRLSTGSTLQGPRVEFLRAVSGREELTTASGRPHLTLYPTGDRERSPFEVDAEVTELAGEEMARARGEVVIRRPDLEARADSAAFDIAHGGGVLHGSPEVEARGIRLVGDTIRLAFSGEELREVWARGRAFAAGDSYDVAAEEIRALIVEERAREVWAFGAGRSVAASGRYRVYGDSLRFGLSEGQIDAVVAVGEAIAEEQVEERGAEPAEGRYGEPIAAEREASAEGRDDPPAEPGSPEPAPGTPETGGQPPETGGGLPETGGERAATAETSGRRSPGPPEPGLRLDGTASWMAGDTLYAIFEPDPSVESEEPPEEAEEGGRDPDVGPAGPISEGRRLARIRVVSVDGTARAYYAAVMDSARTSVPSRNYMIGEEIEVLFEEGEVARVRGRRAIGLYLDPAGEDARSGPTRSGREGRTPGGGG